MADYIGATPQSNPLMGLLAERLKQAQQFAAKPFGYQNPPAEMLMNLLGVPAVQQTAERLAYGEPLTTGRGMTTQIRPEALEAAMTVAPVAGLLGKATKGMPGGLSIKPMDDMVSLLTPKKPAFDIVRRDASETFGSGSERVMYKDPQSGGTMEVLAKPDGTASVLSLEVPETSRGKGIGQSLQAQVMQDFPEMMGQVSSKAAAKTAYRLGRRPPFNPDATLDDVYKMMDEDSSVNLVSPEMQKRFVPETTQKFTYPQEEAMKLAQQRAALPVEQGGLGLLENNTAAERAKAMGFDIESLHGTSNPNIERFDPSLVGTKAGNAFDNYMWSTTSPDAATGYSLNKKSLNDLPEIQTLKNEKNQLFKDASEALKNKDTEKFDRLRKESNEITNQILQIENAFMKGEILSEGSTVYPLALQRQEFMPYEAGGKNWKRANLPAIEQSQDLGYQGVQINNVVDNPNSFLGNEPATTFATENPDLMRSRFAAFDPFRRTAAIAAAMGVAAPDLLAKEQKPKKKKNLLD